MALEKITILNIGVCNIHMIDLLKNNTFKIIIPLNVDVLMKLQKDKEFYSLIKENIDNICICMDSQVIRIFSKIVLGKKFIEKISGSDYLPKFCKHNARNKQVKIFLLGAKQGVGQLAKQKINNRIGREIIIDTYSPSFGFESNDIENKQILQKVNDSGATILAVGLGAPKQEKWILKNMQYLPNINLFLAVGATIDFESGHISRAPVWVSKIGLEWLYRLIKEPRRLIKRYFIDDFPFFWLLLKQRLGVYRNPFEKDGISNDC